MRRTLLAFAVGALMTALGLRPNVHAASRDPLETGRAATGDLAGVILHSPRLAGYVSFNRERQAVQVWNCARNAVVASMSVAQSAALFRHALALPEAPATPSHAQRQR